MPTSCRPANQPSFPPSSSMIAQPFALQSFHGPPHTRGRQHSGNGLDVLASLYLAYDLLGGATRPIAAAYRRSEVFGCLWHRLRPRSWSLLWPNGRYLRPASRCRLSSIEPLAGWTTTPCHGKHCFPPSKGWVLELDCTRLRRGNAFRRVLAAGAQLDSSSTSIFFAARSSLVIRKRRTCPARTS